MCVCFLYNTAFVPLTYVSWIDQSFWFLTVAALIYAPTVAQNPAHGTSNSSFLSSRPPDLDLDISTLSIRLTIIRKQASHIGKMESVGTTASKSFLRLSNVAFLVLTSLKYQSISLWASEQVSKYELSSDRSFDLSSDFDCDLIPTWYLDASGSQMSFNSWLSSLCYYSQLLRSYLHVCLKNFSFSSNLWHSNFFHRKQAIVLQCWSKNQDLVSFNVNTRSKFDSWPTTFYYQAVIG